MGGAGGQNKRIRRLTRIFTGRYTAIEPLSSSRASKRVFVTRKSLRSTLFGRAAVAPRCDTTGGLTAGPLHVTAGLVVRESHSRGGTGAVGVCLFVFLFVF